MVTLPVAASSGTFTRTFLESIRFVEVSVIFDVIPDPLAVKTTSVASSRRSPCKTTSLRMGPARGIKSVRSGGRSTAKFDEDRLLPVAVLTPMGPVVAPNGT